MVAVAVPAKVEELVLGAGRSVAVELGELMIQALPLGVITVRRESGIGGICAVDETEVCGHEIERSGVGGGLILQEISSDSGVVDV